MPITRRTLLGLLSGSTYLLTVGARPVAALDTTAQLSAARFEQGVASADPQPDAVMLWTRAIPAAAMPGPVRLLVEVSRDEHFTDVVLATAVSCDSDSDFTLRTFIQGLQPDTYYYYRFRGDGQSVSRTGRTRTAPLPTSQRPVNIAFASCQNYEDAHYGSWARMIAQDQAAREEDRIDVVLHLGDFIYERSWHTRIDGSEQARKVPPFPDGVEGKRYNYATTLADYRHLYKVYLSDPHLQEARARWPFVCTWDDHEYANDNFQSYTTYHAGVQLNPARKQAANQAWFEFIPAALDELTDQPAQGFRAQPLGRGDAVDNLSATNSLRIYRKLQWGKHVDLVLTDSRSYRSAACVAEDLATQLGLPLNPAQLIEIADAGTAYDDGKPPATLPYGDGTIPNPARDRPPGSMLGAQQRDWFLNTMANSTATWKVWGNAIPLLPMRVDLSRVPFNDYEDSVVNTDGWGGYPFEVRTLIDKLAADRVGGVVSLSGDHHLHGAATINRSPAEPDAPPAVVDFATAGISSAPVFEELQRVAAEDHSGFRSVIAVEEDGLPVPMWNMSMLDGVLAALFYANTGLQGAARWLGPNAANHGLKFMDVTANGYGLARFTAHELTVRLVSLGDCRPAFEEPPAIRYTATFTVARWENGESPQLEGPAFDGAPPFPFDHDSV